MLNYYFLMNKHISNSISLYMSVFDIFHGGLLVTPLFSPTLHSSQEELKTFIFDLRYHYKNLIKTNPPPPTPQPLPFYIYTCRLLSPFTLGVKKYLLKEPVGYLFYFLFLPIPLQIVIIQQTLNFKRKGITCEIKELIGYC